MLKKIPGNVQEDSEECRRRFRGMFRRIPGNVRKDSGECSKRFRGILKKIKKKKSCDNPTFDLSLERYENKDLDVLGDVGESKRKTFS